MTVICLISVLYSTAQCKLERRIMRYGLNMTHCSFYTCASMHVHARLMMPNLSFKTLMYVHTTMTYTPEVCMTGCRQMHVCQEHICQIWIMCMQIARQGQQNYLYQNVHVLKCDSPHDTKHKSH